MRAVVITTINEPTAAIKQVAAVEGWETIVVGDRKTPVDWDVPGVHFLEWEGRRPFPCDHYAQKNRGYVEAIRAGALCIAETDDDNFPMPGYLQDVKPIIQAQLVRTAGWVNVYEAFTDAPVWPRGLPLRQLLHGNDMTVDAPQAHWCPVQQYLANGEPDVDAVYRLTSGEHVFFDYDNPLALPPGVWSPFNSQNTVWWPEAYPYMYLPSYVPMRMTDIWRSFVAARCLEVPIGFLGPTMIQRRNDHDLDRDFADEVPGYLHNDELVHRLWDLDLSAMRPAERLRSCYAELIAMALVHPFELPILEWWIANLAA